MKTTFTSLLLVNRLITSLFTLTFLLLTVFVSAFPVNTNISYFVNTDPGVSSGIEYASLTATASEKAVLIDWVTVSEQNNSHFEVERSLDMKAFKTVALILDGFNANGTGKKYKFKESAGEVNKGKTVYYRLKQIDTDNQAHYSAVMAVQMNAVVVVFPKETAPDVRSNNGNTQGSAFVDLQKINPNGQILLSKQSDMGLKNVSAESVKLTAGIFTVQVPMPGTLHVNPKLILA